jgi:hypothetical protein
MKLEKSHYWKASVEIEASNIAFATAVIVHRKGMRIDSIEIAEHQSWLKDSNILFDSGKRIKGWIKEQVKTMKPSLADKLRYSLSGNSINDNNIIFGHVPIGTLDDIGGLQEFESDVECKKPDKFETYPFKNTFVGENKQYVNNYYYTLPKQAHLKSEIFCWTKDFSHKDCKTILETFGSGMGIGDMHSQGFGKFKLLNFNVIQEGDIL